ncbi:hypothetical protein BJF78_12775 [Pseudonocardia sp. CNS-139]|nr:hypothetical protein BJF78_12775 [Pseudonocardia sp. CNS-139]
MGLSVVPDDWSLFLGLESSAIQIESWDALVVPGLFQTKATAEALIRAGRRDLDEAAIARLVELRMARRREVLERTDPPTVWRVIAEPALRWVVGGRDALREQLAYLIELAERPKITIQVLPLSVGAHAGVEGAFTILSAPQEIQSYPGCVFVEGRITGHYYEDAEHIARYRDDLNRLRVQATRPEETAEYLQQLLKDT